MVAAQSTEFEFRTSAPKPHAASRLGVHEDGVDRECIRSSKTGPSANRVEFISNRTDRDLEFVGEQLRFERRGGQRAGAFGRQRAHRPNSA
jgi:hypothetical protein